MQIIPGLPSIPTSVLYILAIIAGIVGLWYGRKMILPWIQSVANRQESADMEELRKNQQKENQKDNRDSDALDQAERRHDHGG